MSQAQRRHAFYYLALVQRDPEDWSTISRELPQIQRAWQAIAHDDELVLEFVWAMDQFYLVQNRWKESIRWDKRGLEAARALGLRKTEGELLNNTGLAYYDLGDTQQALEYCRQALLIQEAIGDRVGQAMSLHNN